MTGKEIIKEIKRYLDDQSYNYAVLIDGEWGCGKTYFVKNELKESIIKNNKNDDSQKVIYVSLYGCKTLQDFYKQFLDAFLKEMRESKGKKHYKKGSLIAKTVVDGVKDKYIPNTDVHGAIVELMTSNKYIYIFDDLERCDCSINEVFGYINGMVEHDGAKIILIANEKEIKSKRVNSPKELQFLVAANPSIEINKKSTSSPTLHNTTSTDSIKYTKSELEQRRKALFFEDDVCDDYKIIKEKLIGVTFHYQPDLSTACQEIINKANLKDELKNLLLSSLERFIAIMSKYYHNNLRTFQFFVSRVSYLYEIATALTLSESKKEYLEDSIKEMVWDCFSYAVQYKSNYKPFTDNDIDASKKAFPSVDTYLKTGTLISNHFATDISNYIEITYIRKVSSDDPFKQLQYGYYSNSEQWCRNKIEEIKDNLIHNKYPTFYYQEIIVTIQTLLSLGFEDSIMNEIKELMISNISSSSNPSLIDDDLFYISDSEIKSKAIMVVKELNEVVKARTADVRVKTVKEILESDNWAEELEEYINENFTSDSSWSLFSLTSKEKWLELIFNSSIENLSTFRRIFRKIYQKSYSVMRTSEEDIAFMKVLINKCDEQEPKDLIKKNNVKWFKTQLEEVVSKYEN